MTGLAQDVRHSLRQLRGSPWFTLTAILTLAFGIGANTAVFSALNALLLRMLPVRDPQNLYTVTLMNGGTQPPNTDGTGNGNTSFSYPVFEALRRQSRIFSELIAHVPLGYGKVPVRYGAIPTEKTGEEVSGNYFSGLGVSMLRGNGFTESDERNHESIVVLSYGFWTDAFSRDPAVIGRTVYLKGAPFAVVGVTPRTFFGVQPGAAVDFWIPLQNRPELNAWGVAANQHTIYGSPRWWFLPMVARLARGVTPAQAEQAAQASFWQAASEGLGRLDPKQWPAHLGFEPIKGIARYSENYNEPLKIMMALVGLVLLIACTNVTLLIVARNAARQREFALRIATGASTSRLFRQFLVESLLLVSAGAFCGWVLAINATRVLASWTMINTGLAPDRRVLLFTLGISCTVALVCGFAPLWNTLRLEIDQTLRSSSQNVSQSRSRVRGGNVTVALQISMCLTLLVASGMTVRTLLNYEHIDLGMSAQRLLVFDVAPQGLTNNAQAFLFYQRLLERLRNIPGVESASLTGTRPGSGWYHTGGFSLDGMEMRGDTPPHVSVYHNSAGPDFFRTMGIPILQGREITDADTPTSRRVAVVSESFAKHFLKTGALGHRIGDLPGAEIIGVVKDSKLARAREAGLPTLYLALSQSGMLGQVTVEIRSQGNPMALLDALRRATHDLDPNLPLQKPMTQAAQFEETYVTPRLFARLTVGFGVLAVLLVATGLYATLTYRVQRRTNEIGVRMALGAPRVDVLMMILRESLLIFVIGFVAGLPMTWAVASSLRSQFYGLNYFDPSSLVFAAAVTLIISFSAALLPARRAAKVDPIVALRYE